MIWNGLEPGIQWLLALALAARWILTGVSMAYERFVTSHANARRSRRDADLNEAKHRDARVRVDMLGALGTVGQAWRKEGRDS